MTNLLKMVTVTFSILFAVVLTASTATAATEILVADLTAAELVIVADIQPTLDYFENELGEVGRADVASGGKSFYNHVGDVIAVAFLDDGSYNLRVADSNLGQYVRDGRGSKNLVAFRGDFIINVKDVGQNHVQYNVINYWGAATNF